MIWGEGYLEGCRYGLLVPLLHGDVINIFLPVWKPARQIKSGLS